jgi:hypothetical protein
MMWAKSAKHFRECTKVIPTSDRPGSEGTYIVRLSEANRRLLKVRNGAYLKVSYGKASALARLSVDKNLDDKTIRIDQTLRTAICLEKVMQGVKKKKELVYDPTGRGTLERPIAVERSGFRGPSLLGRLVKQQYLVCLVHHAKPRDMEKPIARLATQSMEVLGVEPGDKVLLASEKGRKSIRCLALDSKDALPLKETMRDFTAPCPETHYDDTLLPWVTIDLQTRRKLGVEPWEPIMVGRDPYHALAQEFSQVGLAVALSALGGAVVVPEAITQKCPWAPWAIVGAGFVGVLALVWLKIRSRI